MAEFITTSIQFVTTGAYSWPLYWGKKKQKKKRKKEKFIVFEERLSFNILDVSSCTWKGGSRNKHNINILTLNSTGTFVPSDNEKTQNRAVRSYQTSSSSKPLYSLKRLFRAQMLLLYFQLFLKKAWSRIFLLLIDLISVM